MPCVSKDTFLFPLDLRREKYPLPEYGEDVYVMIQAIGSKDLVAMQKRHGTKESTSNLDFVFDLLSLSLVDDEGVRLFDSGGDVQLNISLDRLKEIGEKCCEVSGLTLSTEDEEKKV